MERAAGIEPACLTWKDSALPLSYARVVEDRFAPLITIKQAFFAFFCSLRGFWMPKSRDCPLARIHRPPGRPMKAVVVLKRWLVKQPRLFTPNVSVA